VKVDLENDGGNGGCSVEKMRMVFTMWSGGEDGEGRKREPTTEKKYTFFWNLLM